MLQIAIEYPACIFSSLQYPQHPKAVKMEAMETIDGILTVHE